MSAFWLWKLLILKWDNLLSIIGRRNPDVFFENSGKEIYIGDHLEAQVSEDRAVRGLVIFAEELSAYIILCFDSDEYFTLGTEICQYIEVVGNVFDESKKSKKNDK